MTAAERIQAVTAFGFTERQARFLVTAMLHAGVCLGRQYCAFAGIRRGQPHTEDYQRQHGTPSAPREQDRRPAPGTAGPPHAVP